ncbi:hypothetical protein BDR22DRAFT_829430, partial [Usnea florida]
MHRHNLVFILRLYSVLLSCLLANAAVIPSPLSILPPISPITQTLGSNTSNPSSGARCVLPIPPSVPVSLEACLPALRSLLASRSADTPFIRRHATAPIILNEVPGCVISMDRQGHGGSIEISNRRIVDYARQLLLFCQEYGYGGWVFLIEDPLWIIIVSGQR